MSHPIHTLLMRRAVGRVIRPLAEFFEIEPESDDEDGVIAWLGEVISRAEDVVLSDEHTLARILKQIDERFDRHWPSEDKLASMMRRITEEHGEVQRALEDFRHRPELRDALIEEIGDLMLASARMAIALGCVSGLEPLGVAARKTLARLRHFEQLVSSSENFNRRELWRIAKSMARAG